MKYRFVTVALTALLCSAQATPAMAQGGAQTKGGTEREAGQDANRAAARDLGQAALAAYKAGDYQTALDKFQRAHQLVGLTTTQLWTARSLEKLGRLVEAAELYLEVTRMSVADDAREQHRQAIDDARSDHEALMPRIPKLTISVVGGDGQPAVVTLDGQPLPTALLDVKRPTDPGEHTIVAKAGALEQSATVALVEGQDEHVTLKLQAAAAVEPGPPQPPIEPEPDQSADTAGGSTMATLGWVAIPVGGAGLLVGAVGAGVAASNKSDLEDSCVNNQCPPDLHDDVDSFESMRIMSSVGFIAGGVIAAAGIVLVIAAPSRPRATGGEDDGAVSVTPYATPTGLGVMGRF